MNNKLEAGMGQGRDMKNKLEAGPGQGRDYRAILGSIPEKSRPGGIPVEKPGLTKGFTSVNIGLC